MPIIFFVYGIIEFIILREISSYYTTIVGVSLIAALLQLAFLKRKRYMPIIICAIIKYLYSFGFTVLLFVGHIMVLWDYIIFNHIFYITIALGLLLIVIIYLAITEIKKIKQIKVK